MDLIIGAPVHERGWVLPDWFQRIAKQELPWGWNNVEIVLNYGHSSDSTLEVIEEARSWLPWTITVIPDEGTDHSHERKWSMARYETMSRLRNRLLGHVREQAPTYYLSLDTDILLPDGAIMGLIRDLETSSPRFDAVGPTVYMTPRSKHYPNAMSLRTSRRYRLQHQFTEQVDVVFAAVMMLPSMYQFVDYAPERRGEDIGWGLNAQRLGKRMGLNPMIVCKHVMSPEMLDQVDARIGW